MTYDAKPQFLWGFHSVNETIRAGRRHVKILYVDQSKRGARFDHLTDLARKNDISCQLIAGRDLSAMVTHDRHQGFVAKVSPYPLSSVEAILDRSDDSHQHSFILILDQVTDPQNLGAIARSAYCAGVDGVILPRHHSAPPSPAAVRASAGALEHLHLAYVANLVQTLKRLKKENIWIIGAHHQGATDLFETDLILPMALVIGGEEKGLRPLVRQQCDFLVSVPQKGVLNSLNASAAAAVILFEIFRQKKNAISL